MDWRRLMNRASDRFEILGVERERIHVSIPADDIEGMMRHRHAGPAWAVLDQNFRVLFLVDCVQLARSMKIALGIRRAHFDLAFLIQITLRNTHRSGRFENKIIFLFYLIRDEPVSDAARNDNVIFGTVALFPEYGLERASALEHKDNLVSAAILIILELAVRFLRTRPPRGHVLIEKNRDTTAIKIAASRNVCRAQMMMTQRAIACFLQLLAFQELDAAYPCRRTQMIHNGIGFVESLRCDDVFVGDAFVLKRWGRAVAVKPNMMFSRNLTELMI